MAGHHRALPPVPPRVREHARGHPPRGQHAACPRPPPRRGHRSEPAYLPQVRRLQSHGILQGPRDDPGHLQGGGSRLARRHLRLHRQHVGLRRGLCRARGHTRLRHGAQGRGGHRQALAGGDTRSDRARGRRQLRPGAVHRHPDRGASPRHPGEQPQSLPSRRPEDGGLRGGRPARARAGLSPHPRGERRQYLGLLARLPRVPPRGPRQGAAEDDRLPGRGRRPHRRGPHHRRAQDPGHGHSHRQSRLVGAGQGGARRLAGLDRLGHRRGDRARVSPPRPRGGHLHGARVLCDGGRPRQDGQGRALRARLHPRPRP